MEYNIDYILNRAKIKKENLIKIINSNNKDKFLSTVFAFEDLEERNSKNIIIIKICYYIIYRKIYLLNFN